MYSFPDIQLYQACAVTWKWSLPQHSLWCIYTCCLIQDTALLFRHLSSCKLILIAGLLEMSVYLESYIGFNRTGLQAVVAYCMLALCGCWLVLMSLGSSACMKCRDVQGFIQYWQKFVVNSPKSCLPVLKSVDINVATSNDISVNPW